MFLNPQLLLLAEKTVTERELRQCIEQISGSTLDTSDVDKFLAVLKKYSKCMVSHGDKQHTVLILDKVCVCYSIKYFTCRMFREYLLQNLLFIQRLWF